MLAGGPLGRLEALFQQEYPDLGGTDAPAVFIRHESEGRLHCELKAYLSPGAAVLAGRLGAEPCTRPALPGLSLLAGPEDSWAELFPEYAHQTPSEWMGRSSRPDRE